VGIRFRSWRAAGLHLFGGQVRGGEGEGEPEERNSGGDGEGGFNAGGHAGLLSAPVEKDTHDADADCAADASGELECGGGGTHRLALDHHLDCDQKCGDCEAKAGTEGEHAAGEEEFAGGLFELGEECTADDDEGHAEEGREAVADAEHDASADGARDDPGQEHRSETCARFCCRFLLDLLNEERDVGGDAVEGPADGEGVKNGDLVERPAEECEGEDRIGAGFLDAPKDVGEDDREGDEGLPPPGSDVCEAEQEGDGGGGDKDGAGVIDVGLAGSEFVMVAPPVPDHPGREDAEGDVAVEDAGPADRVDEEAAEERAGDGGQAPDGAEEGLDAGTLFKGEHVTDHDEGEREEAGCAEALEAAEDDEPDHGGGEGAEEAGDKEEGHGPGVDEAAAKDVAEFAGDGDAGTRGEDVDRERPAVDAEAAHFADNGGHGRGNDGGLHGTHEGADHEPESHEAAWGGKGVQDIRVKRDALYGE